MNRPVGISPLASSRNFLDPSVVLGALLLVLSFLLGGGGAAYALKDRKSVV